MNAQQAPPRRPIRIANCSGFYGDRMAAAREMVEGGDIDVLTGDYLGESTMLVLHRARRGGDPGYARSFLAQLNQVLRACAERGVKIVVNAGGLEPARLAADVRTLAAHLGVAVRVAHIEGDDLLPDWEALVAKGVQLPDLDTGAPLDVPSLRPVSVHAYLGGWGITAALTAGADIVVAGRVGDVALTTGAAAWWHHWARGDWDPLAGAVAAGHVLEGGTQATGGNYPFLEELPDQRVPGFPIAEIAYDGSALITKHRGTGGVVSVGTVVAQLLGGIGSPAYVTPDVTAYFDTLRVTQEGRDRVLISGARGITGPHKLKVGITSGLGYRNTVVLGITGLDVEAKAALAEEQLFAGAGGRERFDDIDVRLQRSDKPAELARTAEEATAYLHVTVKSQDPDTVGRAFTASVAGLASASFAGFHPASPPTREIEFGGFQPTLIQDRYVRHVAVLHDGRRVPIEPHRFPAGTPEHLEAEPPPAETLVTDGMTRLAPLGLVCGARSGARGSTANVGLWTRTDRAYTWLRQTIDADMFRKLMPETREYEVRRYELPNLRAVNFVVVGLLGTGPAASAAADPLARGLGEFLRSRLVEVPVEFLNG